MKKSLVAILFFVMSSCTEEQFLLSQEIVADLHIIGPMNPTYLLLRNRIEDNFSITSWSMKGYEFKDLDIPPGIANQFVLVNKTPKGYKNISVSVIISSSTNILTIRDTVNFTAGKVTKITILGCVSCGGYQIESSW